MEKYWQSLDEYNDIPDQGGEKSGSPSSRRDFLKLLGFSVTSAAILSSCEKPVQKAIPYVIAPEEIVPGKARYYASSFYDGKDFCNILVKTRDGRPIKIEGNDLSTFSKSGTTARVQASVLSLYDDARYRSPLKKEKEAKWEDVDREIERNLRELSSRGKRVVLLTSSVISPSTQKLISDFSEYYGNISHVSYDPVSCSGILTAAERSYGKAMIPGYRFDKADVVVSFGADFLGSWISPVHFIPSYVSRRKLDEGQKSMLKHIQLESTLSLTGSNADIRIPVKPSKEKEILMELYKRLTGSESSGAENGVDIEMIATALASAGAKALVVSGSNDPDCQLLVNAINQSLGNTGITVDPGHPINIATGNDAAMQEMIEEMESGEIDAILMYRVNPVYDYPDYIRFREALEKMEMSVSFSTSADETSAMCDYVCPSHHYLESWDDAEPVPGFLSLSQPCIHPVFNTRSFQESLLKWMGKENDFHTYIQSYWEENYYPGGTDFKNWWNQTLQNGILEYKTGGSGSEGSYRTDVRDILSKSVKENGEGLEMVLFETVQMGDGKHANNPWLQELPDPVTKVSWENALLISPADAKERNLVNGDVVNLPDGKEVPVLIQAGQAQGSCALALGYGRTLTGKVADERGINAFPYVRILNGRRIYYTSGVDPVPTGKNVKLALTQTHNSMEDRPIVRSTRLDKYLDDPAAGNEVHEEFESLHKTLYPEMEFAGIHWGLAVDLNACVGCNTCVIACQAENNIPVVGKEEVHKRRIMHWIKIDRYYSGEPDNPEVLFQPVMCQHCDNAPCENVCPVSATNHSSEGLNQMSYNRCIGTKYCINNCPYRVRRFNWYRYTGNEDFDYHTTSDLGRMVLNPDVTVRSRGVVEKCSFCVQRIQEKKLQAKLENRTLRDGEVQPACVQACPAGALIFGDLRNNDSKVKRLFNDPRNYHLLEQLHTLPSVGYLTKVRNPGGKEES